MKATQSYWNQYDETGQAIPVPRLMLAKSQRIDRMPTQYEREEAEVKAYWAFCSGMAVGAVGLFMTSSILLLAYKYFGPGGVGVLIFGAISCYYFLQWRKERRLGR